MRRAKWHPTAFGGERETKSSFLEQRLGGSIRGEQKRRLGLLSLPLPYSRALSLYYACHQRLCSFPCFECNEETYGQLSRHR